MAAQAREIFNPKKWAHPTSWLNSNPAAQAWTDNFIWSLLKAALTRKPFTPAATSAPECFPLCREVLMHHELTGLAGALGGESLTKLLGAQFAQQLAAEKRRTEIFIEEVEWMLLPKLTSSLLMPIGAYQTRRLYTYFLGPDNPRQIHSLLLWLPAMPSREEVIEILTSVGYHERKSDDEQVWVFKKVTQNVDHVVKLKSKLWEPSNNWSSEMERAIWDRSVEEEGKTSKSLEPMDLFVLTARHYTIDTLCAGANHLLDLAIQFEKLGDGFDWVKIQQIRNSYAKPLWVDVSFLALEIFGQKTGTKMEFPDWLKKILEEMRTGFWSNFLDSRLFFSSPDSRIAEFSRAYVKLAKGD